MTFEETWEHLMGPLAEKMPELRTLTLAFYKAGEVQAIMNADRIIADAIAMRNAAEKKGAH